MRYVLLAALMLFPLDHYGQGVTDFRGVRGPPGIAITGDGATGWLPATVFAMKSPADAVATTFYRVSIPWVSSIAGTVELEVHARDTSGWATHFATYRTTITNPNNTPIYSTLTEVGKSASSGSGNYGLSVTVAIVPGAAGSGYADIQITADTTGALGNGGAASIWTKAVLTSNDALGRVTIAAQ